jgi:SIR2-like protein
VPDALVDIPAIPPELLDAAQKGKLVIFIGAGVSSLVGARSWTDFAGALLTDLVDRGLLSFSDLDQLRLLDARKRISMAMDIYDANGITPDFRTLLNAHVAPDSVPSLYTDLYSIGTSIVTTNYDEWLDALALRPIAPPENVTLVPADARTGPRSTALQPVVSIGLEQLTIEKLARPGNVVHLHGSVTLPTTMILTARQYLDHYGSRVVREFLEQLFGRYTVLFIGYGLEEDEILEHVLRKRSHSKERRHCRLYPSFSHQALLTTHLASYSLNHCSTLLVQYSLDQRGHAQLADVISAWGAQLRPQVRGQLYLEKVKILEQGLEA